MGDNLKRRIRRVIADETAETQSETVSEETLKAILGGNAGEQPADVENELTALIQDGTVTETDSGYRLVNE